MDTLIFVTILMSLIYSRKKKITSKHRTIVTFVTSALVGLLHITNWSNISHYYADKPLAIVILFFVHIINGFSGGLIFMGIF